jgi:hypothetical protein
MQKVQKLFIRFGFGLVEVVGRVANTNRESQHF